ncbi:hypothetical protein D3C71_2112630 [compost metagenome]
MANGHCSGERIYSMPSNQLFQWPTMENSEMVAMAGMEMGRYTEPNIRKEEAPSTMAASSSSFGMVRKKFIMRMTFHTLSRWGRM